MKKIFKKAWVITVDMGYGHQRASYPLRKMAEGGVIIANNYPGIPERDKTIWGSSRRFYEFISRFKRVPFLGEKAFELFDKLQAIPGFYPRRDLSKSNIQLSQIYRLFAQKDWGKHLIEKISRKPLPLVTPFFTTAMMAEYFNYPGPIFCVVCDADVSRTWAPPKPQTSRIHYFAPCKRVAERLKLYGVRPQKIFLTGFPLPEENLGRNLSVLKADLGERIANLDPKKVYWTQYRKTLIDCIGEKNVHLNPVRPLTLTFAVGGAGAQREIGVTILQSLKKEIASGKICVNLVAGTNGEVKNYFKEAIAAIGLSPKIGDSLRIIFEPDKQDYFRAFNRVLRTTDVLWTKPSELTFYSGLGLPIIMTPPIGSQEIFNRRWLTATGAGIRQEDPRYANEWLFDWLDSGWLAEAAVQGFLEAPKYGTYNIGKIIFCEAAEVKEIHSVLQY